ncbi:translation initiation factor IF-2 [Chenggangzhangella methanolivorans]|uniref:Translation initiation factor IF-2 n=1 Tax=Chenggangzhangella methanolivorans TaxID=1437009 RepID=A0A9E6RBU8_9HYPH|nr:translation initiation factor IF-2 [Chenggangzhangella methanolivorans]QZO01916.1 translation initiation factor IF-2 [Chenggangzhangella methanolivorans]
MTDTKTTGDKTLTASPKTLTLKGRTESGLVKQSFSHGRTNAVVVEKVKRRVLSPGEKPAGQASAPAPQPQAPAAPPAPAAPKPAPQRPSSPGVVLRTLTNNEVGARAQALAGAKAVEAEAERKRAEADARARIIREANEERERLQAEARKREEDARRAADEEAKRRAEVEASRRLGEETAPAEAAAAPAAPERPRDRQRDAAPRPAAPARPTETQVFRHTDNARPARPGDRPSGPAGARPPRPAGAPAGPGGGFRRPATTPESEEPMRAVRRPGGGASRPSTPAKPEQRAPARAAAGAPKERTRLTITAATGGAEERTRSVASYRRRVQRMSGKGHQEPKEKLIREVVVPETITVQELANRMSERAVDVVRLLMKQGVMKKINELIDADTAQLIAEELGHTVRRVAESDVEEGLFDAPDAEGAQTSRPPVVTIMGHVDHGKTSLLDAIRHTKVVKGEAGGITQHIGAYQVTSPLGGLITFIDTPGHAAFTAMRQRGAKSTDIVVLVVAADDGVMPQTAEAVNHARAAGVPIIVAINKIDKEDANPQRVRTDLLQYEIQVESLGGETLEVEVSAKTGDGLDKLLEVIQLQAEILDLKANADRTAEGTVIEAKLDRGRGPVATVLVQRGTLKQSDIVVAGSEWGRVRMLVDDKGGTVPEALPSTPVEILGFNGAPEAGDRFAVVENEARAREIADYRQRQKREQAAARATVRVSGLEEMMSQIKTAGRKELPLVIKGDVQGSVEAIVQSLEKVGNDEVGVRILLSGAGGITESDVILAAASKAAVIGFNVRALKEARDAADRTGTEIRYYNIIYDLVDDIKSTMSGMLSPERREEFLGNAKILEIFSVSKVGKIAGCLVTDGVVQKGAGVRLIRDNVVIHEGKLATLKRFKEDAPEIRAGTECGMSFENYQDMRAGDVIECYRVTEVKRTL